MIKRILTYLVLLWLVPLICFAKEIQTPLEKNNFARLSSHSEMMEYLNKLNSQSNILTLSIVGKSVQGREIPALFFSLDKKFGSKRESKVVVLVYCQHHGNEPSGKEAALFVARNLLIKEKAILQNLDLILIPQVNPDGAEMGQRRNSHDMDLNRNHAILSEPESMTLHSLFLKWMPEVTVDVHEFNAINKQWISNGFTKDAEETLDGVSNLNIAPEIIKFSTDVFIPEVGELVKKDGFRFSRYIVGAPFERQRIRHSTTAVNDGRQSMGIFNTLSFIIEGKRYGDLLTNIKRRTAGQVSAITAFLRTTANHAFEIKAIVRQARKQLLEEPVVSSLSHIQMDYFPEPEGKKLTFPVFDLYSWHHIEKELENYEPQVRVIKSIQNPFAYIFSNKQEKLIRLFLKHEIAMSRLKEETEVEVESYLIRHVTPGIDEDKPTENVDVEVQKVVKKLEKGSIVVFLNQPAANLIPLLLEPQSTWSIAKERSGRKYRFKDFIQEGKEYPIYRIIKPVELELEALDKT